MPRDYAPTVRAAGTTTAAPSSVANCLTERDAPPTPDNLKPYRTTHTKALGQPTPMSPARARDAPHPEGKVFGKVLKGNGTTQECMQSPRRQQELGAKVHRYASERLEPLGAKKEYPTKLPEGVEQRRFGQVSAKSESARAVMYPPQVSKEDKTTTDPGVQKTRNYDWTINPATHRFGATCQPDGGSSIFRQQDDSHIVSSPSKAARSLQHAEIGSPHRTGRAPPEAYDPKHVFGKSQKSGSEPMSEVLRNSGAGSASDENLIGAYSYKSPSQRKLKAMDREKVDSERCFGVPSIRSDRPTPDAHNIKVTSGTGYLGDPNAGDLLYNGELASVGRKGLSLDECIALADRCGFNLTPSQVATAYNKAVQIGGGNSPQRRTQHVPVQVTTSTFSLAVTECGF